MADYTPELARRYAEMRDRYTSTDGEVFGLVGEIGVAGKRVMDYGCGDGRYAGKLAEMGAAEVVGIDSSEAMIELARARFAGAGPTPISFSVASGLSLPFPPASFDLVFAYFVLHHFPDMPTAIREIARVLVPGGTLVATTSLYRVSPEARHLLGAEVSVRLGKGEESTVVTNFVTEIDAARAALESAGFRLSRFDPLGNPDTTLDPARPALPGLVRETYVVVGVFGANTKDSPTDAFWG